MLNSIAAIPGVLAAALFRGHDDCMYEVLQPPYDSVLLAEARRLAAGAEDCFASIGVEPARITAMLFDQGTLVVGQSGPFSAVVIASREANFTMLRVALNVVVLKALKSVEAAPGSLPSDPAASWRSQTGTPASGMMGLSGSMGASQGSRRDDTATNRMSASVARPPEGMSWGDRSTGAQGVVGMKVMHHLLRVYSRYVGNDARRLLERELLDLRATPASLTVQQFADLIRRCGVHITDPIDRRQFQQEALGDRGR